MTHLCGKFGGKNALDHRENCKKPPRLTVRSTVSHICERQWACGALALTRMRFALGDEMCFGMLNDKQTKAANYYC